MHANNDSTPRFLRYRQTLTVSLLFGGYAALYFCRADLSVGAPLIIDEVYRQIAEIRKTGIGLLLVEQSPKWIADCDRIYLIENGEVRMQGTPKEVLESEQVMQAYLGG